MNKHIVNALKDYGFTFEKNNGYGFINGYEVNVVNNPMAMGPVFLFSTYLPQTKKNDFVMELNSRKISLLQCVPFDFGVAIMIGAMTAGTFEKKFPSVLSAILEILESLEAPKKEICPQSGENLEEVESKVITLQGDGVKIRLSTKAVETVNSMISKNNEDFKNMPNNYAKGFGGILIGALAGLALTIIFSLAGIITAFSSLVAIFLGVFLYKKFGGKPNGVMIFMSFATTLIVLLGAVFMAYVMVANQACVEAGVDLKGIPALNLCLEKVPEFRAMFIGDMALNGLFILLGEGFSIFRLSQMIRRPKNIE